MSVTGEIRSVEPALAYMEAFALGGSHAQHSAGKHGGLASCGQLHSQESEGACAGRIWIASSGQRARTAATPASSVSALVTVGRPFPSNARAVHADGANFVSSASNPASTKAKTKKSTGTTICMRTDHASRRQLRYRFQSNPRACREQRAALDVPLT